MSKSNTPQEYSNVSSDLIWEIVNGQNSFLVKRKQAGGVQFSRDPFNLTNKHSRKYEGFVNAEAIGVTPHPEGGLVVKTKDAASIQKPASAVSATEYKGTFPLRKAYATIVDSTTKKGYRSDLRAEAVARASQIKLSQRQKKDLPTRKARGKKAVGGVEAQE